MTATFRTKRIYETPSPDDGYRVLVDRLWPRGVSKDAAHLDEWAKDVAPSSELRTWFGHEPSRFAAFAEKYEGELKGSEAFDALRAKCARRRVVTLLYAARDTEHNEAIVLQGLLSRG